MNHVDLVADAEHAVDLMGRDAFLAGGHQEQRRQPLGQRDFGALENGLDGHGELLAALGALKDARTVRFALQRGFCLDRHCRNGGRPDPAAKPVLPATHGLRFRQ